MDRGICDNCGKAAVSVGQTWVCPNCHATRDRDPGRDVRKTFPDGYWTAGGARGPDRSR